MVFATWHETEAAARAAAEALIADSRSDWKFLISETAGRVNTVTPSQRAKAHGNVRVLWVEGKGPFARDGSYDQGIAVCYYGFAFPA
jgi:hypothetical protein